MFNSTICEYNALIEMIFVKISFYVFFLHLYLYQLYDMNVCKYLFHAWIFVVMFL